MYLPEPLKEQIERVATRERRSEADVIRAALEEYTASRPRPRPRLPLFEGKGTPDVSRDFDEMMKGFGEG